MQRLRVAMVACLLGSLLLVPRPAAAGQPPNVLLIVTDDQRAETLTHGVMPNTIREIANKGVLFQQGFVTNPLCCPSRASILTGTYNHTNGVWSNHLPGAFGSFDDTSTVATWLQGAGYRTGLFGKYLNGYGEAAPTYVPPGWTDWHAFVDAGYYDFSIDDNTAITTYTASQGIYASDLLSQDTIDFIQANAGTPWFAYVTPYVPHTPTIPRTGDEHLFDSLPPWRPPSYNEADVSDKPRWIRHLPLFDAATIAAHDQRVRDQYSTLFDWDEDVGSIMSALRSTGQLTNTMVIFLSDNGFTWGEHRLFGKNNPYDSSTRVPFAMRADFLAATPHIDASNFALNIDLAPTISEATGVAPTTPVDGTSLISAYVDPSVKVRNEFLIEHADGGLAPAFCALRRPYFLFIRLTTGEEELYNYRNDPSETTNLIGSSRYRSLARSMRRADRLLCQPLPPGMSWG
jgi:N-acetylglucosamine-6-sulfatase